MDVPSATLGASSAAIAYSEQLEKMNALQLFDRRRDRRFGIAKLAVAACAVIALVFVIHRLWVLAPLLVLVLVFVVLLIGHEKVLERIQRRERTVQFYARGMARLNGEWAGGGATGDRYLDAYPSHVYARDLDLFGAASVFQYLCTAQTRAGEDTLASWLLEPAPVDQILARQMAVRDLASRLKFREQIASGGE